MQSTQARQSVTRRLRRPTNWTALLLFVVTAGCGRGDAETDPVNLLVNGSFEHGREPWYAFQSAKKPWWGNFGIIDDLAYDGEKSVWLGLDSRNFTVSTGIRGAVQDVDTQQLPRWFSGVYRVEAWQRSTPILYAQLVVMAMRPDDFPEMADTSVQLAVVLTGIDEPPVDVSNRRFRFDGPKEPEQGRWIPFEVDLPRAFEEAWGKPLTGFASLRVFIESRFDGFEDRTGPPAAAGVLFDALYLGDERVQRPPQSAP